MEYNLSKITVDYHTSNSFIRYPFHSVASDVKESLSKKIRHFPFSPNTGKQCMSNTVIKSKNKNIK